MIRTLLILLALSCLVPIHGARAHALDPGYLELQPLGDEQWRVTWRKPQVQGSPMPIDALLPETCETPRGPDPVFDGRAFSAAWITRCPGGIAGNTLRIEGLEQTRTDVLVRFSTAPEDTVQTHRLTPDATAFEIPLPQGRAGVLRSYFLLGLDHILQGLDHLLFVFALLLLVRGPGRIAGAITAFTVAHSLTLGGVTLGLFSLPSPPVEAVVALSIVILASELLPSRQRGWRLAARFPWSVAFAFGLLHGFGFADALREIGLPAADVPLALLAFNLGVEAGQLIFIFAVLALGQTLLRLAGFDRRMVAPGSPSVTVAAYAIGSLAAFWTIERVVGMIA